MEAVAPVEVGLKSPRVEFENTDEEILHLNLDLLEEKREQVLNRAKDNQRKTAKYYDRRAWSRSFKPGDVVLKKLLPARKDPTHGKLGLNWEGTYVVSRIVRHGNYELQTEEGKPCHILGMPSTSSVSTNRPRIVAFNEKFIVLL